MGIGDQLIGTGLARGAAARRKKIAFGDGRRILWDANSAAIFADNPNIVPRTGREMNATYDVEWIPFYKGNRLYNRHSPGRWVWNHDFRCVPGEIFLTKQERQWSRLVGDHPFVVMEPNPSAKSPVANKRWPFERYEEVARALRSARYEVIQFNYPGGSKRLTTARSLTCPSFRHALAILERARLYVGGEGGLHHGAAAVGVGGVVLFGGFVPPLVTGYAVHANLTGGAEACGSLSPCAHCRDAMEAITVNEVLEHAMERLCQT